jgi:signal transduction histidine kinase
VREIYLAGEALSKRVDELLDVGRIEQGLPLPLNLCLGQPEPVLQKVVSHFRLQDGTQPIEFYSDLPVQFQFSFDEHRFRQMVENLLSNAMKYSPEKGIIEISARIKEKNFQLEVRDQGIGMSADQKVKVFDKFYRADKSQNWISGLGIGMSIVKSIVEAHQGKIEIESQLDLGTLVRIQLPLAIA